MKVKAYITHKLCERYADCQDRFSISANRRTIAVSDGMSQTIFPEKWAEILATQYAEEGHCSDEDRKALSEEWLKRVHNARKQQINSGRSTWMLDNMLAEKRGAGATICGVTFENATDWQGDVLGDSCIIEIDKQKGTAKVLSSEEKAFDSYPDFYDSYADKLGRGTIRHFSGSIGEDKLLLLASDPFSEFFQKSQDDCKALIEQILGLNSHEDFCALVDNWREAGMHNDDSTLCVIEFNNDLNFNVTHQDSIEAFISKEKEVVEIEKVNISEAKDEEVSSTQENPEPSNETSVESHKNKSEEFYYSVLEIIERYIRLKGNLKKKKNLERNALKEIKNLVMASYKQIMKG